MRPVLAATATIAVLAAASACSVSNDDAKPSTQSASGGPVTGKPSGKVVLITHDSFDLPKKLVKSFEKSSGINLVVSPAGDAGELASKLELSKDAPLGDAAYGIDNTFSAAVDDAGVFSGDTSAIDTGYVCVNVDDAWFDSHHVPAPKSFDDLVKPAYKNLFVTPGATTSSPGMAFVLATIGKYGEDPSTGSGGSGWKSYWQRLMANGAKIDKGWTEAFETDYSASGGDRPIVVSYNTDPSYTVKHGKATTSALLDTCFHQTEYAGVLNHAKNPVAAQAVVDWLQSPQVQAALPGSMYVYPVSKSAPLPAEWKKYAPVPSQPIEVAPDDIAKNRREWTSAWTDIVSK